MPEAFSVKSSQIQASRQGLAYHLPAGFGFFSPISPVKGPQDSNLEAGLPCQKWIRSRKGFKAAFGASKPRASVLQAIRGSSCNSTATFLTPGPVDTF